MTDCKKKRNDLMSRNDVFPLIEENSSFPEINKSKHIHLYE